MLDLARLPHVANRPGERLDYVQLVVRLLEQKQTAVGSNVAPVKSGRHSPAANGRKRELYGYTGH